MSADAVFLGGTTNWAFVLFLILVLLVFGFGD